MLKLFLVIETIDGEHKLDNGDYEIFGDDMLLKWECKQGKV